MAEIIGAHTGGTWTALGFMMLGLGQGQRGRARGGKRERARRRPWLRQRGFPLLCFCFSHVISVNPMGIR